MKVRKEKAGIIISVMFVCISFQHVQAADIKSIFTWTYNNQLFSIVYNFDQSAYDYYKEKDRVYDNFSAYLKESSSYPVVDDFADRFKSIAAENRFSDWQLAECVIAFIQSMNYMNDGTYEYPRYPIETLVEKGGDCEDTSILLEALLRSLGFDCVLVSPDKHMGVGIALKYEISGAAFPYRNKYYYYIETTSSGWKIGDYPEQLTADVAIYDPGDLVTGKLLSEYNYTYKNYISSQPAVAASEPKPQEVPVYHTATTAQEDKPDNCYTIDVDEIVINCEKETMVTQQVSDGDGEKIIATSK